MRLEDIIKRNDEILELAQRVIDSKFGVVDQFKRTLHYVDTGLYTQLRASGLSFIHNIFGREHPTYVDYENCAAKNGYSMALRMQAILRSIRDELAGGWFVRVRGLVSAEIFSDFMEMAEHLLNEGYKDAAAVMIGSVLEEHLRKLCEKYGVSTEYQTAKGDMAPKKADILNADLVKEQVYNKLTQKQVTAWLGLRNDAAHGHYDSYVREQVEQMFTGVLNFMVRVPVS